MMEFILQREKPTGKSMPGELFVEEQHECWTIERDPNDPDFKPIPAGRYPVHVRFSNHFQRNLPHIDDVPGREAIEIHVGNYATDSEGCVLVGQTRALDFVGNSIHALEALIPKIQEPCWITVCDAKDTA